MEYYCKIHDKKYKSYKSLWKHNFIYHKVDVNPNVNDGTKPVNDLSINLSMPKNEEDMKYVCIKCNKRFKFRQGKWAHQKICKEIEKETENKLDEIKNENLEIKNKNIEILKEMAEYKAEMEKLKDLLQKSLKIHPKTLQKINNQLNNNNTNNGVINNITYVQLGNENLVNVLTKSEKRGILNRKAMGINDLVELIHCSGKYKEFMNVYITNLQNTVAYRYDKKINNFIVVNKNELLDEIIDSRIYDITKFFEEAEKVLEPTTAADIKRIIKKMETDDSFKGLKKEEIKFILYNNKDKIATTKDKLMIDNEDEFIV